MKDFAKMLFKGKFVAWKYATWEDHRYLITKAVTLSAATAEVNRWNSDPRYRMDKFEVVKIGRDEADALMETRANIYPKAPFRCAVKFTGRFKYGSAWWFYMNDPIDSCEQFLVDFTDRTIKSMNPFIVD